MPPRITPKKGGCSWTSLDQICVCETIDQASCQLRNYLDRSFEWHLHCRGVTH
jgi:hypothetical protein